MFKTMDKIDLLQFDLANENGLPIFSAAGSAYTLFYTPGYLCVVAAARAAHFASLLASVSTVAPADMITPLRSIRQRAAALAEQQQAPFEPVCLTLYLHNQCNLRCVYCFTAASPYRTERLSLDAIRAAAELVAINCVRQGEPLHLGLHGGGEPSLDRELADEALTVVEMVAAANDLPVYRYIASNGAVDEPTARWMAHTFDQIGLSCDGPPDIQNSQRPRWNGAETAFQIAHTAHILRQEGVSFHVRTTLTAHTAHRQTEVAEYLCSTLQPNALHFEPVYGGGRAQRAWSGATSMSATELVGHFLAARRVARHYSVPLFFAGTRLNEIHGPYCNVLRNVINLVPGDGATSCFKCTTTRQANHQNLLIGGFDQKSDCFVLDEPRIAALRAELTTPPAGCRTCFNQFHCVYGCPETCWSETSWPDPFRCQVQKSLASALLAEIAAELWHSGTVPEGDIHVTAIR